MDRGQEQGDSAGEEFQESHEDGDDWSTSSSSYVSAVGSMGKEARRKSMFHSVGELETELDEEDDSDSDAGSQSSPEAGDDPGSSSSRTSSRPTRFADSGELQKPALRLPSIETDGSPRIKKKGISFADDSPASVAKKKKGISFGDDSPITDAGADPNKSLRFTDEDSSNEKVGAKRSIRFSELENTPSRPSRVRFSEDATPRKRLRFADELPGARKKYSMDDPVSFGKTVRFLIPSVDAEGNIINRTFFPGVRRKRRGTIKQATVEIHREFPLWFVLYLMDTKRFRHFTTPRQAFACSVFCWITSIVSALAFMMCVSMLALFIRLRPQIPILNVESLDFLDISLTQLNYDALVEQQNEGEGNYFAYDFTVETVFLINYWNNNTSFDIYNYDVEVTLMYKGVYLGRESLGNFLVERGGRLLLLYYLWNAEMLDLVVGYTLDEDRKRGRYDMMFEIVVKAQVRPLASLTTSRVFYVRVRCDIVLTQHSIEAGKCL